MRLKVRVSAVKDEKAVDIRVCNKNLYFILPDKTSGFVPRSPLAFLAGLFDGDGHIKQYPCGEKWIFSQAKFPHLVKQVTSIVQKYGKTSIRLQQRSNNVGKPVYRVSILKDARKALSCNEFAEYCVRLKINSRAGRTFMK